ncbi:MAG: tetratricopeptide repeat protein [Lachnospiraceae bacterium]|nr:tetratricopeptide repeat protein [Lachnospiraceae bacterium]
MGKRESRKQNKKKVRHHIHPVSWIMILLAGVLTLLCALYFITGWGVNAYFVKEAQKGRYHSELEIWLTHFKFPNEYVIWYNIGNYYYENGDYEEAEEAYKKALECEIPYEKECPVRVNLALSMMAQLDDDEWEAFFACNGPFELNALSRKVEKTLLDARDVLIEDGCAHENDEDGHDEQAQQLKDEIDELLESSSLSEESDSGDEEEEEQEEDEEEEEPQDEPEEEDTGEDEQEESVNEEVIMEYIEELLEQNEDERTDQQQQYEPAYGSENGTESASGENGEVW